MAGKFSLSRIFKPWSVKDSSIKKTAFNPEFLEIPLLPIFNTQSNQFDSVYFDFDYEKHTNQTIDLVEQCLSNINYWHCHGRAIRCVLPIHYKELINKNTVDQIETRLIKSKFPIGIISFNLCRLNEINKQQIKENLSRLSRLGITFEISLGKQLNDLKWLPKHLFKGVHLPIEIIRNANQDPEKLFELTQFIEILNANNFHKYCRDIGLVHDLIFAKKIGIEFCYGSHMMNSVSKHQILTIKESQFAKFENNSTPSFNITNGEHR